MILQLAEQVPIRINQLPVSAARWQHGYQMCSETCIKWKVIKFLISLQPLRKSKQLRMEQRDLKNLNNCLNTNIYSYLEKSGGQSSNLYLHVDHFYTHVLIRRLWQLVTVVFLHWCQICLALLCASLSYWKSKPSTTVNSRLANYQDWNTQNFYGIIKPGTVFAALHFILNLWMGPKT